MTADSKDRWTIRGVPSDMRDRVSDAAKARNITVGAWLMEVVKAALAAQPNDTAPTDTPSPLEARIAVLEARIDALEADRVQKPVSAPLDAVEPVEPAQIRP